MRRNRSTETFSASKARNAPATGASSVNVTFAAFVACAGAAALGFHLAATNGVLDQMVFELGVGGGWRAVAIVQGLVVGVHLAGVAAGSLWGESLSEWVGLRQALLLVAQLLILSPLACMYAPGFEQWDGLTHRFDGRPIRAAIMLTSRFITGAACGVVAAVVPMYIQEVEPSASRGLLGGLNQLSISAGIVLALLTNVLLPASLWRAALFVGEVPAIALALGMLLCPESPRWLVRKGRRAEADAAALWLWGPNAASEMSTLGTEGHSSPSQPSPRDAFVSTLGFPRPGDLCALLRKAGESLLLLVPYQPLCGIHPLVFFSTIFFMQVGVTYSRHMTLFIGLANLLGTLASTLIWRGLNHKAMLGSCWLGQALAMFAIALAANSNELVCVAGCLFCALIFGFGAGPTGLLTKLDPSGAWVRGPAVGHWLYNVVLGTTFPLLLEVLSLRLLWSLLGAAALLEAVHCWALTRIARLELDSKNSF